MGRCHRNLGHDFNGVKSPCDTMCRICNHAKEGSGVEAGSIRSWVEPTLSQCQRERLTEKPFWKKSEATSFWREGVSVSGEA